MSIETLLQRISLATEALQRQQDELETQLKQYQDCRKEITNEVGKWYEKIISSTNNETVLSETEQYKQPIDYIFEKRVVPGRDWDSCQSDKKSINDMKGVVTTLNNDGSCTVRWDDGTKSKCSWGKNNKYDIKVVAFDLDHTPLEFKDQIKQPVSWIVGRKVKRGKDWKGGSVDDNKTGIVVSCSAPNKVIVHWENDARSECRWGHERCYDIEVVY